MELSRGLVFLIVCLLGLASSTQAHLHLGYYAKTCPRAEKIISEFVYKSVPKVPTLAAAFIRMHFHDCFVRVGGISSFFFSIWDSVSELLT